MSAWLATALRRLRDDRLPTIGLVLLILVTAFVFAVAPRLLDALADEALRAEVRTAPPATVSIQLIEQDRYPAGPPATPLARMVGRGDELEARIPASVRALVVDHDVRAVTARWRLLKETSDPAFVRLRLDPAAAGRVRFVEGRPASDATRTIDGVGPEKAGGVVVYEAAVSRATATGFGLAVGDEVPLQLDTTDPLAGRRSGPARYAAIVVVGIYDVVDPASPWWLDDTLLAGPSIRSLGGDARQLDADVLVADGAYPILLAPTDGEPIFFRYLWREHVDPERLDAARLDRLVVDLRRLQAAFPTANVGFGGETAMRSGLLDLIERQQVRWSSARAILTVVALGPAAAAIAALGLIVVLAAQRRRQTLALARGRGASGFQVVAAIVAEGLLLAGPAVAVAAGIAIALLPGSPNRPTLVAAAAVAAIATVLPVAASLPSRVGPALDPSRDGMARRLGPRRLVAEACIVAAAIGGAYLLRERGIRGPSTSGGLAGGDPLIAAVPALAGVAAGLIAVRLYPLPIRLLARIAAARRDLVPLLAMRRAAHGAAGIVLVVLLATVALGSFASAALVHLDRASEAVAWQEVGAPYRVTAATGSLPRAFDPKTLPGVEAAAGVYRGLAPVGNTGLRVELLALDVTPYAAVVRGTPADPGLPAEMLGPRGQPIPAIVSTSLTSRSRGPKLGETFVLNVEAYTLQYRVVAVRDRFPGLPPSDNPFVVVSREQLRAAAPNAPLAPSVAVLRAPNDAGPGIREALETALGGATVDGRAERAAALRGSPVLGAVRGGIGAAALVGAVYAALAVAAALALAGVARAIEVAHLRTIGLTRRQAVALVVVEHGPTVLVAFGVGLAAGFGLFLLLRPGLGLEALVGSPIEITPGFDIAQFALVLAAIIAIVAAGMALGAAFRGAVAVTAVRRGFE